MPLPTFAVAGDDEVIVGLVAGERAVRSRIREMLRELGADLAALGSDIGEAARGQKANRRSETQRLTPIDHDPSAI